VSSGPLLPTRLGSDRIFSVRLRAGRANLPAPMAGARNFTFICGQDDYLVTRAGEQAFAELAKDVADEFSREVISGFAGNVGEVETALQRFRESVQTVPMFGGKRAVWLRDVNFLADTVTGRAEGTLKVVEQLQEIVTALNPEETSVLITAAPVDRRRSFPKWCEKNSQFTLVGGDAEGGGEMLAGVVIAEAKALGAGFGPGAVELLLARVGPNTRLLVEETRKLAAYAENAGTAAAATITEDNVADLTPNTAEGDFFETAEAFFSGDLKWTLAALHRHFFAGGDARPVISALQNRNRLLLQVRTLIDAGEVRLGARGLDGIQRAAAAYTARFGEAAAEKSSYNVFAQNPWYLGKLAGTGRLPTLRRLIDNQQDFIAAFAEIVRRPQEQEEVLRDMAVRCLAA
jgi:DNA polymerase-3 subunit delta